MHISFGQTWTNDRTAPCRLLFWETHGGQFWTVLNQHTACSELPPLSDGEERHSQQQILDRHGSAPDLVQILLDLRGFNLHQKCVWVCVLLTTVELCDVSSSAQLEQEKVAWHNQENCAVTSLPVPFPSICPVWSWNPGASGGGQIQHPSLHVEHHPCCPEGHRWPPPAAWREGRAAAEHGETRPWTADDPAPGRHIDLNKGGHFPQCTKINLKYPDISGGAMVSRTTHAPTQLSIMQFLLPLYHQINKYQHDQNDLKWHKASLENVYPICQHRWGETFMSFTFFSIISRFIRVSNSGIIWKMNHQFDRFDQVICPQLWYHRFYVTPQSATFSGAQSLFCIIQLIGFS